MASEGYEQQYGEGAEPGYFSMDPYAGIIQSGTGGGPYAQVPLPQTPGLPPGVTVGAQDGGPAEWVPPPGAAPAQTPQAPGASGGPQTLESLLRGVDRVQWAQGLAAIEPQLKALGYSLQRASDGSVRGRIYRPDGTHYDPFGDYGWVTPPTVHSGVPPAGAPPAGTLGSLAQGSLQLSMPTKQDLMQNEGFQWALDRGRDAVEKSAFARGVGLTGGTLKDLSENAVGMALHQAYFPFASTKLAYNQANVGNLYNLANLGLTGSSVGNS